MKRLFFIFIIACLLFTACSSTARRLELASLEPELLPIFIVPSADTKHGNGLLGVSTEKTMLDDTTMSIEYTLIFNDEDHPSALLDGIYDVYRRFRYKRIADTETFYITFIKTDAGSWTPSRIKFPNVYSEQQQFYEKHVQHYNFTIDNPAEVSFNNQRVMIYVNTWNHMLAHFDTNPSMQKQFIAVYPVYSGSREAVEAVYAH